MSRFVKGTSGNPGGRPKGFERLTRDTVRELQRDGDADGWVKLVQRQFELAMGQHGASPRDQTAAAKLLKEWGYGPSKQRIEISGEIDGVIDAPRFSVLSAAQLEALAVLDEETGDDGDAVSGTAH